jgi:hypothetical protein
MGTARQAEESTRGWQATAGRHPALGRRPVSGDQRSGPGRPAETGPRPLVTGCPATSGHHLLVGRPRPGGDQRSSAGRGLTPQLVELYLVF